jgi:DNA-binding Xre family transcriptional regulator
MIIVANRFMYFGFHVDGKKLDSYFDKYPAKHPDEPLAHFLRQCPDADKTYLTVTMLRERMGLPDLGMYGIHIGQAFGRILAFGTSKQKFKILTEVLDEICEELEMKRSDAHWYVPDLSEEEWDEMGTD